AGARKNGARGEKCDSILRGGEQDRLPLWELQIKLFFKTVRWTVLNGAYFVGADIIRPCYRHIYSGG
ncbi:MAG: hypothetical protein J6C96_01195, partial [Oscillospiraceae bacterium]|nr:hypothetical protein [Oscillospiraceae bacterium]